MATVSLQAAYDHARRLLESGDTERAIAAIEHILQYFPHNLEAQRMLGQAYRAGRQLDLARNAFQNVLASDPENIEAYVGIGLIYESQGKLDQAIQSLEQALEITPGMKELRAEVLRLYAENWGSEHAQLQVSQSALARMYAKGYMFPQAILEFRKLIAKDPSRLDAHVALAETLWRDGQDDEAIAESEEILRNHPYALKPNLLVGYLRAASGDPQAEEYWKRAGEVDPYYVLAQQMFEQLPYPSVQPTLPEWNEQEWLLERERIAQEKARAEEEASRASIAEPIAAAGAGIAAAASDDSFFGGSWMDSIDTPAESSPAGASADDDDDFLAKLLAFDGISADDELSAVQSDESLSPFSVEDVAPIVDPFSFDDQGVTPFGAEETTSDVPAASETVSDDIDDFEPFSYADLGLSPEEIAALNAAQSAEQDIESSQLSDSDSAAAEPVVDDFDLTISEVEQPETTAPSVSSSDDEPELTPFSLEDLGLSPEEIAALSGTSDTDAEPAQASQQSAELSDEFSFDLPSTEEQPSAAATSDEEPDMTPFSLEDLGLSEDEIAAFDLGTSSDAKADTSTSDAALDDVQPFSLDDWASDLPGDPAPSGEAAGEVTDNFDFSDDLSPFSLDDLDISTAGQNTNFELGSLPSSLQLFSLDDVPEDVGFASSAGTSLPTPKLPDDDDDSSEGGAYSFRPARSKPSTDFKLDMDDEEPKGPTIFAKLRQRHSELPRTEPEPLPPVDDSELDHSLFGQDDVSLRDDEVSAPTAESASLNVDTQAEPEAEAVASTQNDAPASDEPELTPFSLEDLGLSPEEIAALGLQDAASEPPLVAELPETLPETIEEPTSQEIQEPAAPVAQEETTASVASSSDDEPDLTPFSFADLGLTPEEIAAFGLDTAAVESGLVSDISEVYADTESSKPEEQAEQEPAAPAASASDEPELTPFSLEDLGLSPDEIASFGLADETAESASAAESVDALDDVFSFDTDPVVEEPAAPTASASDDEPELTPFSLEDLGLSPEEIASLGLEEGAASSAPAAEPASTSAEPEIDFELPGSDEPDMTPFSLEDLGLTPEEAASFGLEDVGAASAAPAESEATDDIVYDFDLLGDDSGSFDDKGGEASFDDEIRPFSLEDLGIDDEIAPSPFDTGNELGVTEEEMSAMKLDSLGQDDFSSPAESDDASYQVDTGDPVLDELIMIGRRRGYVDLDDIIRAVENPEEESERIEEIGLVLHRAGIQIRDGDEIIDLDEEVEDEDYIYAEDQVEDEYVEPTVTSDEEPDMTPFSLEDLGLSADEIAALGLQDPSEASTSSTPAAASSDEPDMTPFSLEDLGLSPEEIASLDMGTESAAPAASETPASASSDEPDLTPFSLEDLGLSPEEIASLGLDANAPAQSSESSAAPETPAAASSDEPDMTPFSLEDLGLSPEEIASLESAAAAPPEQAPAEAAAPSEDEIDTFDFSVADAARSELAAVTPSERRQFDEDEPPPLSPEDLAFVPADLESLDSIWDPETAKPTSVYQDPNVAAAAVTPEPPKRELPPINERIVRFDKSQVEAEQKQSVRSEPTRSEPVRSEPVRSEQPQSEPARRDTASSQAQSSTSSSTSSARKSTWKARQSPTIFIPTGDATLDGYLLQLEAEPHNTALRASVARIGGQTARFDLAIQQYKVLIKSGEALDQISEDIQDLIEDNDDPEILQKLYRLLGDVYSKQNRFRDAVEAYSWTFSK